MFSLTFVFASLAVARCADAEVLPVLPKCCPEGMMGIPRNCSESDEPLLHPFKPWLNYTTRTSTLECDQYMFMESWEYEVDDAGNLVLTSDPPSLEPPDRYCFEVHMSDSDEPGVPAIGAFMCFTEEISTHVPSPYPIGMIISVPFLAVTAVTYAVIRKLRNLHGRCLVAQCTSMFLAYVFLIVIQLFTEDIPVEYCKILVYFKKRRSKERVAIQL